VGTPDVYRCAVIRTGFFVATNIKIRQGVGYESTKCYRLLTLQTIYLSKQDNVVSIFDIYSYFFGCNGSVDY